MLLVDSNPRIDLLRQRSGLGAGGTGKKKNKGREMIDDVLGRPASLAGQGGPIDLFGISSRCGMTGDQCCVPPLMLGSYIGAVVVLAPKKKKHDDGKTTVRRRKAFPWMVDKGPAAVVRRWSQILSGYQAKGKGRGQGWPICARMRMRMRRRRRSRCPRTVPAPSLANTSSAA